MKIILGLLIFFSTFASADVSISVGAGKNITDHPAVPFERAVALGYQFPIGYDFFIRPEGGYFLDVSGSGKSSFWAAPLLGVRAVSKSGTEIHIAVGPGYLDQPDEILGGHFQFSLEGGLGISDRHVYIGMAWKHLSSAGFEMPNQGRDFITIQLRLLSI